MNVVVELSVVLMIEVEAVYLRQEVSLLKNEMTMGLVRRENVNRGRVGLLVKYLFEAH
jgi:hypothetical protein